MQMGAKIQWADAYIISLMKMVLITLRNLFVKSYIIIRYSIGCEPGFSLSNLRVVKIHYNPVNKRILPFLSPFLSIFCILIVNVCYIYVLVYLNLSHLKRDVFAVSDNLRSYLDEL